MILYHFKVHNNLPYFGKMFSSRVKTDLKECLSTIRVAAMCRVVLQELHEEHLAGVKGNVLLLYVVGRHKRSFI